MRTGASLSKAVILAASGREGEKSDFFNRQQERRIQSPKEEYRLEEKNTR